MTGAKIKDGSVGAGEVAPGAIDQARLANGAVSSAKLTNGAVSGDKLAAGAVSSDKLAAGSVSTDKLADGSVTASKVAPGVLPGPLVVHRVKSTATIEFPPTTAQSNPIAYPLEDAIYTQPPGEDDIYVASMRVHIPATCTSARFAEAHLMIDAGNGLSGDQFLGRAIASESANGGDKTVTVQFAPSENGHGITTAAPLAPTTHTFSLQLDRSSCEGKGGVLSKITITGAQIDVIGIR